LATSDLHMQISAFDYVKDKAGHGGSLAKLAALISQARKEADVNVLLDNGDTLQGTALAETVRRELPVSGHPMAQAFNLLAYDAIGLGNHDFDYGLEYLGRVLGEFDAEVLCSNLVCAELSMVRPSVMLCRTFDDSHGQHRTLKVGLVSALPVQTAAWNREQLEDNATITPVIAGLSGQVADLKNQGADIIVVLAHMGIAHFDEGDQPQNQLVDIAKIEGVDAIVGGHTHLRFPGPDHANLPGVDARAGRIGKTPAVMPGNAGSDLGVIDFELIRSDDDKGWKILDSASHLQSASQSVHEVDRIVRLAAPAHSATRRYLSGRVGSFSGAMNTYFALADASPVPALLATAKLHAIRSAIAGTELAELPLLAAASTPSTGGLYGPGNFVSISAGPITRREVSAMNPYSNLVWAVRTTGAQVLDWLERSALLFNTLTPDNPEQFLADPMVPGFRFDAIYGLSYAIDPTRPPRFDRAGRRRATSEGRICDVYWQGAPLDPDQTFLVATTDHRAAGGGVYLPFEKTDIAVRGAETLEKALLDYLAAPDCKAVREARPWRFKPDLNVCAVLLTAPEAHKHLDDIAHLSPEPSGLTPEGFLRLRLTL
jgi:2',3'-cyclic-nucleotide 2'-phosphodiesterase/3'-nucleotidase